MPPSFGEAGATGATPPLPASAAPASARASSATQKRTRTKRRTGGGILRRSLATPTQEAVPALPAPPSDHRLGYGSFLPSVAVASEGERENAGGAALGPWGRLRGLSQRHPPAPRQGLPSRGRRARLRATARPRGTARLLAVALAVPRRRRHVPPERQRRRDLPGRRAAPRRPRTTAQAGLVLRQLDLLAVDEDVGLVDSMIGDPTRHGVEHDVQLVLRALLDPHLPALTLQRHQVGPGVRHQVMNELRRSRRSGCLDAD